MRDLHLRVRRIVPKQRRQELDDHDAADGAADGRGATP